MAQKNFKIDASKFQGNMRQLVRQALPDAIVRGLGQAGQQLLRDAIMEEPTVPLKEGTLRASGSVTVLRPFEANDLNVTVPAGSYVAVIGFNTPYAAYLHEGMRKDGSHVVVNWSEPGSGAKFLESKLVMFKERYIQIVSDEISRSPSA